MLKQLSIFAENKKGVMHKVTDILQREDINILGSVTNDSAEYGIIRMVVSDSEKAVEALTEGGFICKLTDVLGIEVKDEVGNLNHLLEDFLDSNINIDYLYLSFNRDTGRPIMVLHVEDIMEVEACLKSKGYISL
ncbi:ACT domain-containing protein [Ruminococcus sp. 5_1_39BFAA]|uniref:ACT domain-containing protein n=1 Tax=Ruminococcus sp. 5_1_39BFAA TaxID=457412 RepID=UPI00356A448A